MVFSFTGVFAKAAANAYNAGGFTNPRLYLFVFLMLSVCVVYALAWQIVIKNIIGLAVVLLGVIIVTLNTNYDEEGRETA